MNVSHRFDTEILTHPVHFVCPPERLWSELSQPRLALIDGDRLSGYAAGTLNNWVIRTYYQLRLAGTGVTTSAALRQDAINIASVWTLGRRDRSPWPFVLLPRTDAHDPQLANFALEQNFLERPSPRRAGIAHWPQPAIRPRTKDRGGRLEIVTFKGRLFNLAESFRSQAFQDELSTLGIRLDLDTLERAPDAADWSTGTQSWNDYSDSDVVLAVRDMTLSNARTKPASKLVNAWFAEVVALLGPEPAFREQRRSDLDYIEIRTPAEALAALRALKDNPARYLAMIENGRKRRLEFTEENLTRQWIDLLNGPVAAAFERWMRKSRVERLVHYGAMCLREPVSKKAYLRQINSGPRLF